MFFTCVDKEYKQLAPIYSYCVKRVYPEQRVEVQVANRPACKRFLQSWNEEWVHVTDGDILILPHKLTHYEYYSQFLVKGASYLRGCTMGGSRPWEGDYSRICGGHALFLPEFYKNTVKQRFHFLQNYEGYREFDEVMLAKILRDAEYPIPEKPYTFHDGTPWDIEYRDLHLQDFLSFKYQKWQPDKQALKELFLEPEFQALISELDSYWKMIFKKIQRYIDGLEVHI